MKLGEIITQLSEMKDGWSLLSVTDGAEFMNQFRLNIEELRTEFERLTKALENIVNTCDGPGGHCAEFMCIIQIARKTLELIHKQ